MKTSRFTLAAKKLRALGHPKRLEILHVLGHETLNASDIQRMTDLPQATLSQHLHALKIARIIVAVRHGKHILFRLSHPSFAQAIELISHTGAAHPPRAKEKHRSEVQDPVCLMWVEPSSAAWQSLYKGATYFFCASGCHRRFTTSPTDYV